MPAKLIIIEGVNGSGKSLIRNKLENCKKIFAPGYTKFGMEIRKLCRDGGDNKPTINESIAHCMIADRLETFHNVVKKETTNKVIITDRWFISTIAYQAISQNKINQNIFDSIYSSITDEEISYIHPVIYHITCDEKLITDRILKERHHNPNHGFDEFLSLEYEKQLILSDRFNRAFTEFTTKFNNDHTSKLTVKKLVNNTLDDLSVCINEIQTTINKINQM